MLIERSKKILRHDGSMLEIDQIEVAAEEDNHITRPRERSIVLPNPKTKLEKDKNRAATTSAAVVHKDSIPSSLPFQRHISRRENPVADLEAETLAHAKTEDLREESKQGQ